MKQTNILLLLHVKEVCWGENTINESRKSLSLLILLKTLDSKLQGIIQVSEGR